MRLFVYGSGYKYPDHFQRSRDPLQNELDEIRCGKPKEIGGNPDCHWSPSIKDFEVVARASGGGLPAANLKELLDLIERQKEGSIDELRILGHSNSQTFALAGDIKPDTVYFNYEEARIGDWPTFHSLEPRMRGLRNRFAEKGVITLCGCGSGGTAGQLLRLMSRAFLCCVKGFQKPILYYFETSFPLNTPVVKERGTGRVIGPVIGPKFKIAARGRVGYISAAQQEDLFAPEATDVKVYGPNVWNLVPDAQSCVGQQLMNAAKRVNRAPIDNSLSAFEVGWRILSEFHGDQVHKVSSVGYDANLRGLRVKGTTIDVGKAFVENTNGSTLDQRAKEMGEALHLVTTQQSGVIKMK